MSIIKPLHMSVHSSVRSGVVMFDVTRVVEELIFNSLDAGATKVSVFISIRVFSLKVVDNGFGVTRDGLVLLGERYSTSKNSCSGDIDTSANFGSRGEALASISDISLLEISTKTHGSPNGYRKVVKGCKCLYLGIDDDVKDIGTTVLIRDLFYNQPIRRKYIQSSPKKVLNSLKKCILRFALAHPQISFKAIDIESEGELLCTEPSLSPLPLLRSNFGIDISNGLHELNVHEGTLHLSGYISDPSGGYNFKALQYVYINTQFVCRGPIHKLVNGVAATFESSDSWNCNSSSQNGKRSRPHAYPAYLLKLACPQYLYDLNFEPSKTFVEFKDWVPILAFVEKAVQFFWKDHVAQAGSLLGKFDSGKKRRKFKDASLCSSTMGEDIYNFSYGSERNTLIQDCDLSNAKIGEQLQEIGPHIDFDLSDTKHCKLHKCISSGTFEGNNFNKFQSSCNNLFQAAGESFGGGCIVQRGANSNFESQFLHSTWEDELKNVDYFVCDEIKVSMLSSEFANCSSDLQIGSERKKPLLQGCSLRDKLLLSWDSFARKRDIVHDRGDGDEEFEYQIESCKMKRTEFLLGNDLHFDEAKSDVFFGFEMKNLMIEEKRTKRKYNFFHEFSCQDELHNWPQPFGDIDLQFIPAVELTSSFQKPYFEENFVSDIGFSGSPNTSSCCQSVNSDQLFISSDISLDDTSWFGKYHANSIPLESSCKYRKRKRMSFGHPVNQNRPINKSWRSGEINVTKQSGQSGQSGRSRRSQSAPPFYRQKRRFISLSNLQMGNALKPNVKSKSGTLSCPESNDQKHTSMQYLRSQISLEASLPKTSPGAKTNDVDDNIVNVDKEFFKAEAQNLEPCGNKWRESSLQKNINTSGNKSDVLDISSGLLHMAGDSLIPRSITKNCLVNAKVLPQVDKKFIPIVAGRILALIDQHAADERIQLEDLRQKVLAGEGKTITCLDSEKELVMPEIGHQLLHSYCQQIKEWGWICNFHGQHSRSFQKNLDVIHRQTNSVTLVAVPCILGVNLTEADLIEFLQQLVDTDGASMVPPSVLRVLNSKACRGAIMFGDSLLPSECSLIVEELKQTSLCFQCAHGRPTTVPLVNLDALHKQISDVCGDGVGDESWHGLSRHGVSLERSTQRLRCSQ